MGESYSGQGLGWAMKPFSTITLALSKEPDGVTEASASPPPTYGAVGGDLPPFGVVFQQLELPLAWFPC